LSKNKVVSSITVGYTMFGITVNPETNVIYVANGDSFTVYAINATSNAVIANIPLGYSEVFPYVPFGMAIDPRANRLYVANLGSNLLTVIDSTTNSKILLLPIPEFPSMALTAALGLCLCLVMTRKRLKL